MVTELNVKQIHCKLLSLSKSNSSKCFQICAIDEAWKARYLMAKQPRDITKLFYPLDFQIEAANRTEIPYVVLEEFSFKLVANAQELHTSHF